LVVVDTDEPAVDTDPLAGREVEDALLVVEWDVEQLPNDNSISISCNGRVVHEATSFNARRTESYQTELQPGEVCIVRMFDERGGRIPAGRVYNCSEEVASWSDQRAYETLVAQVSLVGCIPGCNDPVAENYDPVANLDDGTCEFIFGCTDPRALNYDPTATKDDGRCDFGGFGVVDVEITTDGSPRDTVLSVRCDGFNVLYEDGFVIADEQRAFSVLIDSGFDCQVLVGDDAGDDGPGGRVSVCGELMGTWARTSATSSNPGDPLGPYEQVVASFFMPVCSGCTDPTALNYDPTAVVDDGTCASALP
jgi:hypothetical protein